MKFLILALFTFSGFVTMAQIDSTQPPYKRFPTVPPIQILLSDSTTFFKKEQILLHKPLLFMLFSPGCSHCQHETEELIAHKEAFKNIQIVMVTMQPLSEMKDFIANYKLNEWPNIVVGRDVYYTMPAFYNIHNLPFLAMYDKKGDLISTFEGSMPIEKVIDTFKGK